MQVNQIYAILNDIMLEISGQVVPIYNEQGDQINAVPVVQEVRSLKLRPIRPGRLKKVRQLISLNLIRLLSMKSFLIRK